MRHQDTKNTFRLTLKPIFAALLAVFPVLGTSVSLAAGNTKQEQAETASSQAVNDLPDLGKISASGAELNANVGPGGAQLDARFDRQKVTVTPQYSNQTGLSLGIGYATLLGDHAALGIVFTGGGDKQEALVNAGIKLDSRQRIVASFGQLRQNLDYGFRSGTDKAVMTQNSGGLSYQYQLGDGFLRQIEGAGYVAKTPSRNLTDKTFAVDTTTYYELWNDPRRIAGGTVMGYQGKLGVSPIEGGLLKLSLGQERLVWDLLAGKERNNRITSGVEWQQQLPGRVQLTLAAEGYASQTRYTAGLEKALPDFGGGRHALGARYMGVRGREGVGNDNQFQLTWTYSFGTGAPGATSASPLAALRTANARGLNAGDTSSPARATDLSLLDVVAQRPSYMPSHVVAKVDTTALPTRLVVVDKTALPAGSSINAATGDVTVALGVAVTGIAGVTRNGGAFSNGNQFALSGNNLIIRPSQIAQPAVGVTDTYVVTINNSGGGTTLATILVSHGSVRIDSIVISAGGVDITPPVTSSAPAISTAATDTTVSVTQTINETGTGYYLMLPVAAAAPTVAAVKAGTSFAMTAGTPAIVNITGLTASTAYKFYFVAKDAANNDQAAVSAGLAITTAAAEVPPIMGDVPNQTAVVGVAFSLGLAGSVTPTNGDAILSYSVASGALPTGLSLNTSAGVISGTPMVAGTYNVTVTASDNDGASNADAIQFTVGALDTTPDAFSFVDQTGVALSTLTESAAITVAGINTASAISVSGGEYQINSGAWTNTAGTVANGQLVKVRHTASASNSTATNTVLTIGGVSDTFTTTTVAAVDTTPPATVTSVTLAGSAGSAAGYTLAQAITVTAPTVADPSGVYYLVNESSSVPTAGAAGWTSSALSSTAFTLSAGNGVKTVYVWTKDGAGNVQSTPRTQTITLDTAPPVTSSAPAISTVATDASVSVTQTINETGTGYYLMLPAASVPPTVAAVKAGTSFAMTAGTPAIVNITGLTASTAYKYYFVAKDAANNDQAAVSSGLAITTTAGAEVPPEMGDVPNQAGTVGTAFSLALTGFVTLTNGDPITSYAITAGSMPPGISLNTSTGVVSGTPTTAGTYNVTVTASDNDGASNGDAIQFVISVAPLPATPTGLSLVVDSGTPGDNITNNATFNWMSVPNVTSYEVSMNGTSWIDIGNVVTYNSGILSPVLGSNTFYLRGKNSSGVGPASNKTFSYDALAPSRVASATLAGSAGAATGYTATQAITVTAPAVTDTNGVFYLVNESAATPAVGDAGWTSSALSSTPYTLSAGNGVKTVYVWTKDGTENIQSTPRSQTIDLNTSTVTQTADTVTMTNAGGTGTFTITYNTKIYQASDFTTLKFVKDSDGSDAGGSISVASISGNTVTFNYTTPNLPGTAIKVRTSGKNAYGKTFTNLDSSVTTLGAAVPVVTSPLNQTVTADINAIGSWTITGATTATNVTLADNYGANQSTTIGNVALLDSGLSYTDNGGGAFTVTYKAIDGNGIYLLPNLLSVSNDQIKLSINGGTTWYVITAQ